MRMNYLGAPMEARLKKPHWELNIKSLPPTNIRLINSLRLLRKDHEHQPTFAVIRKAVFEQTPAAGTFDALVARFFI